MILINKYKNQINILRKNINLLLKINKTKYAKIILKAKKNIIILQRRIKIIQKLIKPILKPTTMAPNILPNTIVSNIINQITMIPTTMIPTTMIPTTIIPTTKLLTNMVPTMSPTTMLPTTMSFTTPMESRTLKPGDYKLSLVPSTENQLGGNSSTIIVKDDNIFPRSTSYGKIYINGPGISVNATYTDNWRFDVSSTGAYNVIVIALSNGLDYYIPEGYCYPTNSCTNYTYTYTLTN